MCGVLSLTFLFFVLRGVNYWGTEYLTRTFPDQSHIVIRICFLAVAITAPIFGLVCGSNIGEIIVAYFDTRDEYNYYNVLWSLVLALIAALFSIMACNTSEFLSILVGLWFVLFFGGALLPLISVTILEILEPKDRALATGFNSLVQQLFGQGGSLLMTGYTAQNISFQAAWAILLSGSWFAVVCVALMACSLRPYTLQNNLRESHIPRAAGETTDEELKEEELREQKNKTKKTKATKIRQNRMTQIIKKETENPFQSVASSVQSHPSVQSHQPSSVNSIRLKSSYK
jgi:MFS family permease